MTLTPLLFLIIGTIIGSYLNVISLRRVAKLTAKESTNQLKSRRSFCPACKHTLSWWELIPILSFTFLRGRCARCHGPISVQYPIVELACGLIALAIFSPLTFSAADFVPATLTFIICTLLIVLFIIDLRTMLLPDYYVLLLSLVAMALVALQTADLTLLITNNLAGLATGVGFLGLILILPPHGIGIGDIKLMVPLGFVFGWPQTIVLLGLSFIIGGLVGIWLLLRKKAQLKTAIPFGPFLCGTAILLLIFPSLTSQIIFLILGSQIY